MDCLAVDGGYPLFIVQAIAHSHLNDANFCYPVRKAKVVKLETEAIYYVEKILDHRGEEYNIEYFVKWVVFGHKDNRWVLISSFEGTTAINTYWRRIHRNKKIKQKQ